MSFKLRIGIAIVVLGAMVAGIGFSSKNQQVSETSATSTKTSSSDSSTATVLPQEHHIAPDFTLKTIDGKTIHLSQLRGKPVYINIWNSWCPPCKAEMPDIVKQYQTFKDSIQFYGINLTTNNDTVENAQSFINTFHIQFPTLLDQSGSVGNEYKIVGVPTSLFIDAKGVIVHRVTGAMDAKTIESYLKELAQK